MRRLPTSKRWPSGRLPLPDCCSAHHPTAPLLSCQRNRVWGRFAGFLKPGDIKQMAELCGLSPEEAVQAPKNELFNATWQKEVKEYVPAPQPNACPPELK